MEEVDLWERGKNARCLAALQCAGAGAGNIFLGKFLEQSCSASLGVAGFNITQGRLLLEGVKGCWMCYNLIFCRCKG
jgi:hypothetical protein